MKLRWIVFVYALHTAAVAGDVQPLPQSAWPHTVSEAVPLIVGAMSPTQQSIVGHTSEDSLFLLLGEWGDDINKLLGLDHGNKALALSSCGQPCRSEEATLKLMHAAWEVLQH